MAQGHLLPMLDIGRLLAQRGMIVTMVTTPMNAGRIQKSIARAIELGQPIRLVQVSFPGKEVGFADGVENIDMVHSSEPGGLPQIHHCSKQDGRISLTEKVEFTKAQLPLQRDESWTEIGESMLEANQASYGVVINTFEELESAFVEQYRKLTKAWCIGPVSLSHKEESDKAERGNKASINEQQCLKWLDSQETNSVIYACHGSISTVKCPELIE
ncbi:UDP-glycosyltransferase 73C5-like [Hibiscus syriacus]|uniref:UDP-glycosyltransferase 73C5-like n=1 Tax=Hibiscus syriacus TaxID=106335 RepID=UPI0019211E5F|nr:UDP-glycosyltransferase 73C5-like [Hibiscus syriacus]